MLEKVIDKEKLRDEIITTAKEATVRNVDNFFDNLFAGVNIENNPLISEEKQTPPVESLPLATVIDKQDIQTELPTYPEDFTNIIYGYLYLYFKDLNYSPAKLRQEMNKFGNYLKNNSFDEARVAYEQAEMELLPLVIDGILIPPEFISLKVAELKYSNSSEADNRMALRITNTLISAGITYINDLRDKDLGKIYRFGKNSRDEFITALKRTIGVDSTTLPTENNRAVKSTQPSIVIMGIVVPFECFAYKIANLRYSDNKLRTRIIKALESYKIKTIADFRRCT